MRARSRLHCSKSVMSKIDKIIHQKNLFVNLVSQLNRNKRLAIIPKIDVMYLKIDLYHNTGDEAVLNALYFYMVEVNSSLKQMLVVKELNTKFSNLPAIAE
ncbi:hypothetical protein [Mocis latipes granulovirus]|uniref:Uncharacterized protein n=1 Tax=Mocis latipes granulovirus TaxID=2072024 RepID=A0A161C710_9BBAC|nr:hypothetical protein [Mocis latipes granulovirus]AKR17415.1 hypothetical protein [Mocis latipes granulovirus]